MSKKSIVTNIRFPSKRVETARGRKISSTRWLQRQFNDPYVQLAKEKGYRSRAAFKLLEIDKKFKIFRKDSRVLDLGSSPGGWSQVAVEKINKSNRVVATDILAMDPIANVDFIVGDFLSAEVQNRIVEKSNGEFYDVVMSDMAANTTGDRETDHLRTLNLAENALNFAVKVLKEGGIFVTKIFHGVGEVDFVRQMKTYFCAVSYFKPESSRKNSVEIYVVGKGYGRKI